MKTKRSPYLLVCVVVIYACSAPYSVGVRSYVVDGVHTDTTYGAYGYLVLNEQRSPKNSARYERICSAYLRSFVHVDSYGDRVDSMNLMPTFWPLTSEIESDVCSELLSKYDYAFASQVSASVRRQHLRGPVLVAFDAPFGVSSATYDPLVFDLSSFSDDEFDRFFGIWKDRITRNPGAWDRGFRLVVFREEFRSMLLKHGDSILALVK